jgi:uncharacterized membrane protein YqiK
MVFSLQCVSSGFEMNFFVLQEIYKDRKKFSKQVFEVASSDLVNMGITVVSYTLKDIRDEEGYLKVHIPFTVSYPLKGQ